MIKNGIKMMQINEFTHRSRQVCNLNFQRVK